MRFFKTITGYVLVLVSLPMYAFAQKTGGMPWEGPMNQILNSITGPWLKFGCVAAIIMTGVSLAFGEVGGILRRAMMVVLGLSVACASTSWALEFLGFAGGISF